MACGCGAEMEEATAGLRRALKFAVVSSAAELSFSLASRGFPASGCASAHAGLGLKRVDQMGSGAGGAGAGTSVKCLHPFLFFLLGKGGSWQGPWGRPRAE